MLAWRMKDNICHNFSIFFANSLLSRRRWSNEILRITRRRYITRSTTDIQVIPLGLKQCRTVLTIVSYRPLPANIYHETEISSWHVQVLFQSRLVRSLCCSFRIISPAADWWPKKEGWESVGRGQIKSCALPLDQKRPASPANVPIQCLVFFPRFACAHHCATFYPEFQRSGEPTTVR